jgi:hypothetical protein
MFAGSFGGALTLPDGKVRLTSVQRSSKHVLILGFQTQMCEMDVLVIPSFLYLDRSNLQSRACKLHCKIQLTNMGFIWTHAQAEVWNWRSRRMFDSCERCLGTGHALHRWGAVALFSEVFGRVHIAAVVLGRFQVCYCNAFLWCNHSWTIWQSVCSSSSYVWQIQHDSTSQFDNFCCRFLSRSMLKMSHFCRTCLCELLWGLLCFSRQLMTQGGIQREPHSIVNTNEIKWIKTWHRDCSSG